MTDQAVADGLRETLLASFLWLVQGSMPAIYLVGGLLLALTLAPAVIRSLRP